MRCPGLKELPIPPTGKTGWPWTEESPQLHLSSFNEAPWPIISILTPSYNQREYIEETIRSVLLQGYPNLEYIIIDGGSTDGSLGIIKKYESWISKWISEPDRGQSDALNKGFRIAKGTIIGWLNSDDLYNPGALETVVNAFRYGNNIDVLFGDGHIIDENRCIIDTRKASKTISQFNLNNFFPNPIVQSSVFFRSTIFNRFGFLDLRLNYAMDLDLWLKAFCVVRTKYISKFLSQHRIHRSSKTKSQGLLFWPEKLILVSRYHGTHELFAQLLARYLYERSLSCGKGYEEIYDEILIELNKIDINSEFIEFSKANKFHVFAEAYLWKSDFFYNKFDFRNGKKYLKLSSQKDPLLKKKWKYWRLLISLFLPKPIIKFIRKFTRRQHSHSICSNY